MRNLLIAACLAAGTALADAPEQPETVTFTRAQLEALQTELEAMVQKRMAEAFRAGVEYQKQACASLI